MSRATSSASMTRRPAPWLRKTRQKADLPDAMEPVTPTTRTFLNSLKAAVVMQKVSRNGFENKPMSAAMRDRDAAAGMRNEVPPTNKLCTIHQQRCLFFLRLHNPSISTAIPSTARSVTHTHPACCKTLQQRRRVGSSFALCSFIIISPRSEQDKTIYPELKIVLLHFLSYLPAFRITIFFIQSLGSWNRLS